MTVNITKVSSREEQERISKPCWDKANQGEREQYKRIIQQLLSDIVPPNVCDNCDSFKCETHAEEVCRGLRY